MAFEVDPDYVRSRVLPGLIGNGARYANKISGDIIKDRIYEEKRALEQRLSTRFRLTEFRGFLGPGARPDNTPYIPAVPPSIDNPLGTPEVLAVEWEEPYLWPSISPGPGYLSWRLNIRPIHELILGELVLPGTEQPGIQLKPDWFRLHVISGEMELMPKYGTAALILPNLPFGLWVWMAQRIPGSMLWHYIAGMTESDWIRFPQVNHVVAVRAAINILPILSQIINPSGVITSSADGLSVTRKNGYVFADLEDRLKKEAEAMEMNVLDAWDGHSDMVLL